MKGLSRWHGLTVSFLILPILLIASLLPWYSQVVPVQAAVNVTAEEARMLELVNQARNAAGLPSLLVEQRLTDFARSYSQEMIQYNFFGHDSPVSGGLQQRIAARGITGWTLAGENIAKAPSVEVAFQALMNSPGHRANILRPEFNCIGVGVVPGPGGLYITQEFMCFKPIPPTAELPGTPLDPGVRFDTFLLIMNPNGSAARVKVVFQGESGDERAFEYQVGAYSRFTVPVRETVGRGSCSIRVSSDLPVLAERAMYFNYQGNKGGSDSIGSPAPSNNWFFAEGYTGGSFDTWILLQNPNESAAAVTLSFMRPDGQVVTHRVNVPARRRYTVHVDEIPGLSSTDVSTQVTSDLPIVAERAMYFSFAGRAGGHNTIGAQAPREEWYLAEGYTGGSFDLYVLLVNPHFEEVAVNLRFLRPDGNRVERSVRMMPRSRYTVHVDEIPGPSSTDVSTQVKASLPVVAELAEYFNFGGITDGNSSVGASQPSTDWYFAEGCVL